MQKLTPEDKTKWTAFLPLLLGTTHLTGFLILVYNGYRRIYFWQPCDGLAPCLKGSRDTPSRFTIVYGNRQDKLRPDGPLGSNADLTFLYLIFSLSLRTCLPEI